LSSSGARKIDNNKIKKEGSKEEDRQEEVFVIVKNGYTDLKRHHQNDEN